MERYPMLGLVLRAGTAGVTLLAVFTAALLCWLAWPALGWLGALAALVAGAALYIAGRSFVELVQIVTEMLVPR